jgi:hypothetical protein
VKASSRLPLGCPRFDEWHLPFPNPSKHSNHCPTILSASLGNMPVIFQTAIRRVSMWRTKTMAPYGRIFAPYAPKWDYDDPVRSRVPLWDIYNGCVLWLPPQRELSPGALVSPDHFQSHFRLYTSSKLSQRYPFECYRVAVPNSVLEAPAWPCIEKHWSLRYRIKGAL